MRQRCLNPKHPNFPRYGGRGITIAPAWDSFAQFVADLGPRPAGFTLERIDNDGPYAPGNVRWASRWEQGQNRHDVWKITHAGRTQSLSVWLAELPNPHGINRATLQSRLAAGESLTEALAYPADRRYSRTASPDERRQAALVAMELSVDRARARVEAA